MPDEIGTETTRSDAPGADEGLFGDAADDVAAVAVEGEDSKSETETDPRGAEDAGEQTGASEETDTPEDLKVVVSIKGGRTTIGVQRPSADPHIESFDEHDLSGVAQEVPAVVERARARWEDTPKHPAYVRPAPPAQRRNRRQQGAAQGATADAEAEQAQQQTLRLF